jgi:hypothetical protein
MIRIRSVVAAALCCTGPATSMAGPAGKPAPAKPAAAAAKSVAPQALNLGSISGLVPGNWASSTSAGEAGEGSRKTLRDGRG